MDDWELLKEYAATGSEDAFRSLVERHGGLVYHTALRQLRSPHAAEDVTQAVFAALAQKAATIPQNTILSGWLFRATRFAARNLVREEMRRQHREQEASMAEHIEPSAESVWLQISPYLNEALDKLPARERDAVLIRFFEEKSHKEVADALGISEDAAKMRVSRALDRLRLLFAKQGSAVSSTALLTALTAFGAQAAPTELTSSVATAVMAKEISSTASTITFTKALLKFMAWSKAKTAIVTGIAVLLAGGGAGIVAWTRHSSKRPAPVSAAKVDRSTPRGTLSVIGQALESGDADAFLGCFVFDSPADDTLKQRLGQMVAATGRFRAAAIKQFGAEEAAASLAKLPVKLPKEKIEGATIEVDGDSATVQMDRREAPAAFIRVNGEWKPTVGEFFHLSPARLEREANTLIAAFDRVVPEISAGRYQTALDAAQAVHAK